MGQPGFRVTLSAIDEDRFGFRTAKALNVRVGNIPEMLRFCEREKVEFLIVRCPVEELTAVQTLESAGFELMDTLVYFVRDLGCAPLGADPASLPIRPVISGEEQLVAEIALRGFHDYQGHYHADPRLDRHDCDLAYMDWARRSCLERGTTNDVLVALLDTVLVGFITLRLNSPTEGEGVLNAVDSSAGNQGVYTSLVRAGLRWCADRGAARMVISTQITNTAVQRVWSRLGFEPGYAFYTLHKWFSAPAERHSVD